MTNYPCSYKDCLQKVTKIHITYIVYHNPEIGKGETRKEIMFCCDYHIKLRHDSFKFTIMTVQEYEIWSVHES